MNQVGKKWANRLTLVMLGLIFSFAVLPAAAPASGGHNIESAPAVVYGQQEFGNTADSGEFNCGHADFWNLSLRSGDQVTIDWETSDGVNARYLYVFPAGTTDYSINNAQALHEYQLGENDRAESIFSAPATGNYPLIFLAAGCVEGLDPGEGPYDFTARDQHVVVVNLRQVFHVNTTSTLTGQASLADGTPVPDGLVFTLTASWQGHGNAQYTASSSGGTLSFPLSLPASAQGADVTFIVTRPADNQYLAAKSAALSVLVARSQAPSPPLTSHHHRRRHHHHHRRHRH
jgi:hypothetical protein